MRRPLLVETPASDKQVEKRPPASDREVLLDYKSREDSSI